MCFGAFFTGSSQKRKNFPSSSHCEKKQGEQQPYLVGSKGQSVAAKVPERKHSRRRNSERSRCPSERVDQRVQPPRAYSSRANYASGVAVRATPVRYRKRSNSSEEMLLNSHPHRSSNHKKHHVKHASQSTLRGRGAKRTPNLQQDHPPLLTTPNKSKKTTRFDMTESSPHGYQFQCQRYPYRLENGLEQSRSRRIYPHSSLQYSSIRPNTGVRRDPDRRFAVLAATNVALEHVRREAFAQPSPPPRRELLRGYEGLPVPSSSIPFAWDCIDFHNPSGSGGKSSVSRRRR